METCASQWEDGLPPPSKSMWGAAHDMENEHQSSAAVDEELEGSHNDLFLQKVLSQQLSICNSSFPSFPIACTSSDNVKEPTGGNKLMCTSYRDTERRAVRSKIVKGGPSSSSSCMKRSASAALQCANGTENVGVGARVRARRGEATDQHSISERTRRTKITERMRSLHRLVPDATKTNKASMLDEVIQYVSTLQARLKMECTRKLDARGESYSSEGWRKSCNRVYVNKMIEKVLDPQEERLAEAERQVMKRLSHPSSDLSLASTYLASLGLALLPISDLASPPHSKSPPT